MFVSERKLKANRENAQKSTGPKTAGGKAASSDIIKTKINPAKRPKTQWGPRNNDKTNPNHTVHLVFGLKKGIQSYRFNECFWKYILHSP